MSLSTQIVLNQTVRQMTEQRKTTGKKLTFYNDVHQFFPEADALDVKTVVHWSIENNGHRES